MAQGTEVEGAAPNREMRVGVSIPAFLRRRRVRIDGSGLSIVLNARSQVKGKTGESSRLQTVMPAAISR
jgi:hypothetical protein